MKKFFVLALLSCVTLGYADSRCGQGGCSSQGSYQKGSPQNNNNSSNYNNNQQAPSQNNWQSNSQQYGNQNNSQQYGNQNTPDDQTLTKQVQDSLKSAFSSKYNNVNVTVVNGTVILSGSVPTVKDRNAVEKKVRDVNGVRGVTNQLSVQNN